MDMHASDLIGINGITRVLQPILVHINVLMCLQKSKHHFKIWKTLLETFQRHQN
jgi:hypothetical protein